MRIFIISCFLLFAIVAINAQTGNLPVIQTGVINDCNSPELIRLSMAAASGDESAVEKFHRLKAELEKKCGGGSIYDSSEVTSKEAIEEITESENEEPLSQTKRPASRSREEANQSKTDFSFGNNTNGSQSSTWEIAPSTANTDTFFVWEQKVGQKEAIERELFVLESADTFNNPIWSFTIYMFHQDEIQNITDVNTFVNVFEEYGTLLLEPGIPLLEEYKIVAVYPRKNGVFKTVYPGGHTSRIDGWAVSSFNQRQLSEGEIYERFELLEAIGEVVAKSNNAVVLEIFLENGTAGVWIQDDEIENLYKVSGSGKPEVLIGDTPSKKTWIDVMRHTGKIPESIRTNNFIDEN